MDLFPHVPTWKGHYKIPKPIAAVQIDTFSALTARSLEHMEENNATSSMERCDRSVDCFILELRNVIASACYLRHKDLHAFEKIVHSSLGWRYSLDVSSLAYFNKMCKALGNMPRDSENALMSYGCMKAQKSFVHSWP